MLWIWLIKFQRDISFFKNGIIMNIFVIVPVYNEKDRVVDVIKRVLKVNRKLKVIVVDDGSVDKSLEELKFFFGKNKRVILLSHLINLGKGAAMKTGVLAARRMGAEAMIFIDADGQHNPEDLSKFILGLNKYPVVFGYRLLKKDAPWVRRVGNKFADWLLAFLFDIKRRDTICGFWGFMEEIYPKIKWKSCSYEIETEVSTKVSKNKIPFSEIEIDTVYVDKYKGVTIFDAFKILLKVPSWFFEK